MIDEAENVNSPNKDATELELEKLLFGNEDGFFEGLRSYEDIGHVGGSAVLDATGGIDNDSDEQDVALQGVDDQDVRLVDSQYPIMREGR